MKKRDPSQLHSVLIQVLKLLETLRLYADLLRDVADALSDAESSPAGAELAAAGCGPLRVRIASPAAAAQRAEGEREVLICGESSRGKKLWGSYCVNRDRKEKRLRGRASRELKERDSKAACFCCLRSQPALLHAMIALWIPLTFHFELNCLANIPVSFLNKKSNKCL